MVCLLEKGQFSDSLWYQPHQSRQLWVNTWVNKYVIQIKSTSTVDFSIFIEEKEKGRAIRKRLSHKLSPTGMFLTGYCGHFLKGAGPWKSVNEILVIFFPMVTLRSKGTGHKSAFQYKNVFESVQTVMKAAFNVMKCSVCRHTTHLCAASFWCDDLTSCKTS